MISTFEQFMSALRNPAERPTIGLVIGDDDAGALLGNPEWAQNYYQQWSALAPAAAPATATQQVQTEVRTTVEEPVATQQDRYEDDDPYGRPRRPVLRVLLTIAAIVIAFAGGATAVFFVTGSSITDLVPGNQELLNPSQTLPRVPTPVAIDAMRPCHPANADLTVTLEDGLELACTLSGGSARWLPVEPQG